MNQIVFENNLRNLTRNIQSRVDHYNHMNVNETKCIKRKETKCCGSQMKQRNTIRQLYYEPDSVVFKPLKNLGTMQHFIVCKWIEMISFLKQ